MRAWLVKWVPPLLVIALLVAGWEALARLGSVEDYLLPAPSDVARALVEDRDLLLPDAWVTLREVLLGFALALAAGLGAATLLHLSPVARRALYPLVVGSQAIPVIVIAPILVIWFGFGMTPKLIVIALICFFPITVNTLDGLASVDPAQVKMLRTLDASRWQVFRRLELPSALPYVFSGARVAVAVAVIGAVFGELVGSDEGLGHAIQIGTAQLLTARVFAATLLLAVMAIALFALIGLVQRRAVPWAGKGALMRLRAPAGAVDRRPCSPAAGPGRGRRAERRTRRSPAPSSSAGSTWRWTGSRIPTTWRSTRRSTAATTSRSAST